MSGRLRIITIALFATAVIAGALWCIVPSRRNDAGVVVGGMGNGCQCTKRLDR